MKSLYHAIDLYTQSIMGILACRHELAVRLIRSLVIPIPFRIFHFHPPIILQPAIQIDEIYMKLLPKYLPGGIAPSCSEGVSGIRAGQHEEDTNSLHSDTLSKG